MRNWERSSSKDGFQDKISHKRGQYGRPYSSYRSFHCLMGTDSGKEFMLPPGLTDDKGAAISYPGNKPHGENQTLSPIQIPQDNEVTEESNHIKRTENGRCTVSNNLGKIFSPHLAEKDKHNAKSDHQGESSGSINGQE